MRLVFGGVLFMAASIVSWAGDGLCLRHVAVPEYPSLARQARIQGSVILNIDIAENGEVVAPSGAHRLLQDAAEK